MVTAACQLALDIRASDGLSFGEIYRDPPKAIHPSPFLIRGISDLAFPDLSFMNHGSGARLHRRMVPARG